MYTREDLLKDVAIEADNIKRHATNREISRLNFFALEPTKKDGCIYGQMTGNCFSSRAADLIELCCQRYFSSNSMNIGCNHSGRAPIEEILTCVNGTEVKNFYNERTGGGDGKHFSAIEAYLVIDDANKENLIDYIKGITQTLEL